MKTEELHIIHRQVLELELNQDKSDEEIKEHYQQKMADEMMNAMEAIFDGISPENEKLIIDELSLDLGEIPESEFMNHFQKTLSDKLNRIIRSSKDSKVKTSSGIRKISKGHLLIEDFIFYLKKGYLPWWSEVRDLKEFQEIIESIADEKKFINLLKAVLEDSDSRKRLTQQFSSRFNLNLLALLFPHYRSLSETLLTRLAELIILRNRWMDKTSSGAVILESIWQLLIRQRDDSEVIIHFQERVIASVIAELDLQLAEMARNFPQIDAILLQDLVKLHQQTERDKTEDQGKEVTEELTIYNSGLVILWPYLENLYKKLDLLTGDSLFLNNKMQERAVLISQYLITGNPEIQEHQLVLNKILHAWPLKKAVQAVLVLNEKEKQVLNNFLSEIIESWPMLKNSTVEALRESFLQRKGTIRKTDKGWSLQVKRSGLDILRDKLPWPISIINLSWMHTIVYVKW